MPLPPFPPLTLLPAALVTGPGGPWGNADGNIYASIVGGLNVGLAYWLLLGWGVVWRLARAGSRCSLSPPTGGWPGWPGPHHYAELCAVMFAWER